MKVSISEYELTEKIIQIAEKHEILVHHCADSRRCRGHRGLPDLLLVGQNGIIFSELKSEHGDTDADQDLWAWMLHSAIASNGGDEYGAISFEVWRPADLLNGKIQKRLEEIR